MSLVVTATDEGGLSWSFTFPTEWAPPCFHFAVRAFLDNRCWKVGQGAGDRHHGHQDRQTYDMLNSFSVVSSRTASTDQCHSPCQNYEAGSQTRTWEKFQHRLNQCLSNCGQRRYAGGFEKKALQKIVSDIERMKNTPVHVCWNCLCWLSFNRK
jgi:hypothetical protein